VDIGVIYTHEKQFMPRLLESLRQSSQGVRARLILIDNASLDGTAHWEPMFPEVLVLRNERRLTYAENLNRILTASRSPYALLLNTDMYFDPEAQCVTEMVRFMDQHPDCGVSGCRLYHEDGSYAYPARRFQTLKMIVARRLGLAKILDQSIRDYLYQERDPGEQFSCDWLSGCLLMVRRAAWREVGSFDTRFRKYFEDVDFCFRMLIRGWRVRFNGHTYGYHLEQRDSTRLLSRDAWLHLKSYCRWLLKWGRQPARLPRQLNEGLGKPPLRRAA
jgi:GT2 family glycosyltransferase